MGDCKSLTVNKNICFRFKINFENLQSPVTENVLSSKSANAVTDPCKYF